MGKANISAVFKANIKTVFDVVADFSKYPDFLPEVKKVTVIEDAGEDKKLIEMQLQVMKTIKYQIWVFKTPPDHLSWKFHKGEVFKDNSGSWKLTDMGNNTTKVDYEITAKFGLLVPSMIEKTLIEVNLPSMIQAYKKRAESL